MINLQTMTIKKAKEMLKSGEITAVDLVSNYLKNIKAKNKDINAYLEVFNDVLESAKKNDEEKNFDKPLTGIPIAVKDNILIKGKICSAGSKMLENYSAAYDATVIKKLKDAGAIILGRTNMDEFAMGASTENSAFGPTKNPHDLERVAGGSSGGSAAAVAADMALAAIGSDTGGSIRQPAGFCGVVGLNPTYSSVSRSGLIAMASSFDQIGPIAKNVEDAEIIFNVIKGKDELDSTSSEGRTFVERRSDLRLKIGLLKYDKKGVDKEVNEAINNTAEALKKMGHEIKEIDLPHIKYSVPCYYILVPAEVSANLARFDGVKYGLFKEGKNLLDDYMETRSHGFGDEVRRRIMLGTYVLSAGYYDAYYGRAQKVRELIRRDFKNIFDQSVGGIDVILSPVSPTTAFKIGEKESDPVQMYLEDIFTAPAKLAGVPAISVPSKIKSGLPIGIQFIAPWFKEDVLFNIGKQYEQHA
jgi:aspartyl-tRNA(Asn)/glutamyl-tRNA(Gln) amidotransferase subunit A